MLVKLVCSYCGGRGKRMETQYEFIPPPKWGRGSSETRTKSVVVPCGVCDGKKFFEVEQSCNNCFYYRSIGDEELSAMVCINHGPHTMSKEKHPTDCCNKFERKPQCDIEDSCT